MTTTKTQKDLVYAMFNELVGPERGISMRQEFEQRILPMFPSKKMAEVISEEEYQASLLKIKDETPAFAYYLRHAELPYTPPEMWNIPRA